MTKLKRSPVYLFLYDSMMMVGISSVPFLPFFFLFLFPKVSCPPRVMEIVSSISHLKSSRDAMALQPAPDQSETTFDSTGSSLPVAQVQERQLDLYIYEHTEREESIRDEAERSNPPSLHRLCKHDTCDTTRTEAEGDPEEPARPPESSEEKKFRFRFDSREGMEDKRQLPSSSSSSTETSQEREGKGRKKKRKSPCQPRPPEIILQTQNKTRETHEDHGNE
jgi:hypothetical protein